MRYWIIALLVFGVFSGYAYGQEEIKQLDVYIPASTYYEGDVVIFGGSVAKIIADTPVTIQVFSPTGDVVDIAQIDIAFDGSFAHTMIALGPQWTSTGEYRIEAKYGENQKRNNPIPHIKNRSLFYIPFSVNTLAYNRIMQYLPLNIK